MPDNDRTPPPLLEAVERLLDSVYETVSGELAHLVDCCDGHRGIQQDWLELARLDPDGSLTREALADGLALSRLKEAGASWTVNFFASKALYLAQSGVDYAYGDSLSEAVAAALDER